LAVLQFPCRLLRAAALGFLLALSPALATSCTRHASQASEAPQAWPSSASGELATRLASSADAVDQLNVRARTAAERLRYTTDVEELAPAQQELDLCLGALALLPQAPELPWKAWLEDSRYTLPELTALQMRAAGVALGQEVLPLAREMDFREMPTAARLEAHHLFWIYAPGEALTRARALLFLERPRNRDLIRPRLVEELLLDNPSPEVEEILLDVATSDRMEARARMLAVRSLATRQSKEAPAILESLFDTEGRNFLLRKEALLAILAIEPARAHRMLLEKLPSRDIDRGMWEFMRELRVQEGLPVPTGDT